MPVFGKNPAMGCFFPKVDRLRYTAAMILIGREHLAHHAACFPASRTALCLWQATSKSVRWHDQAEVALTFPAVRFTTPQIARFFPTGAACVITSQIAYNTGILIVLAVSEAISAENSNHG